MREVVITGVAPISPNGSSYEEIIQSLQDTQTASNFKIEPIISEAIGEDSIVGRCNNFRPETHLSNSLMRRTDRYVHLGVASALIAVEQAKVKGFILDNHRSGVIIGTGLGGLDFHEEGIAKAINKGFKSIHPLSVPRITPNAVAAHIAMQLQITGPNQAISTACSSSTNAIGEAFRKVRDGYLDICITGGVEAPITPFTYYAYKQMKVLDSTKDPQKVSRPFDKSRDGFVLSEGACMFVIESKESAQSRGAEILGTILGFSNTCGGYNITAPKPDGSDLQLTIQLACADARVSLEDIDLIHCHGTATQHNDEVEARALENLFKKRMNTIPVLANKSFIGHTLGAAGALQIAYSLMAMNDNTYGELSKLNDAIASFNFSNKNGSLPPKLSINNSFGFGSNNSCLVVGAKNYGY